MNPFRLLFRTRSKQPPAPEITEVTVRQWRGDSPTHGVFRVYYRDFEPLMVALWGDDGRYLGHRLNESARPVFRSLAAEVANHLASLRSAADDVPPGRPYYSSLWWSKAIRTAIVTPDVTLDAMAARFFEHPGTVEMIDTGTPSEGREAAKENRL